MFCLTFRPFVGFHRETVDVCPDTSYRTKRGDSGDDASRKTVKLPGFSEVCFTQFRCWRWSNSRDRGAWPYLLAFEALLPNVETWKTYFVQVVPTAFCFQVSISCIETRSRFGVATPCPRLPCFAPLEDVPDVTGVALFEPWRAR